jgi:hypothetical protein
VDLDVATGEAPVSGLRLPTDPEPEDVAPGSPLSSTYATNGRPSRPRLAASLVAEIPGAPATDETKER